MDEKLKNIDHSIYSAVGRRRLIYAWYLYDKQIKE